MDFHYRVTSLTGLSIACYIFYVFSSSRWCNWLDRFIGDFMLYFYLVSVIVGINDLLGLPIVSDT